MLPEDEISITMKAEEWNLVLGILGKVAYETVHVVIGNIRRQAAEEEASSKGLSLVSGDDC